MSTVEREPKPMPSSYAAAGVSVEEGERAVQLMRAAVQAAQRSETRGSFGGFAGMFDASALAGFRHPLLATSTDGVGTKVAVARALDRHDTIGIDLVAMVVDDLVVCGAEPLFLTDYIAVGKVVPERIAEIVSGVARGCQIAGCALLGGETAEHPGLMDADAYDLAGAGTGVVEADGLLGPERVRCMDVVVAMAASGLHANGYSLARMVLLGPLGPGLDVHTQELGRTIGEELIEPTRIYAPDCLALAQAVEVHAFSHITGGGLAANIARVLPAHLTAELDRGTWSVPPVVELIGRLGSVEQGELERTFNMGIGMVALLPEDAVDSGLRLLADRGVPAWACGRIVERGAHQGGDAPAKGGGGGAARLTGRFGSRG